ncbi:MAG: hypothetical protein Q4E57_05155 [Eubacteriales bacterium]|nr:hypothetical protein [Eubacteriales bacterium]
MNLSKTLLSDLKKYIDAMWVPDTEQVRAETPAQTGTPVEKGADYTSKDAKNLEDLIGELGESFHEMLFRKIRESGMPEADIYKKGNLDRKLFSKIRSNPAYHPRKGTVLALAIALQLDSDGTVELLAKAGYALSPGSKADLIVKYFIERSVYDINVINYALNEFGQPTLGG